MSTTMLPQAPGASAAKTTGILSIVFGLLCFPVGLVLAIVALVQHNKAKTAFSAQPGAYEPVSGVGLVTAIIGLVVPVFMAFVGIIAAIAIPALLGQRSRARDKAAISTLTATVSDLLGEYDRQAEARTPKEQIPARLEAKLRALGAENRNPWDPAVPAFTYTIEVVEGGDREAMASLVSAQASQKGVCVFMLSRPDAARARGGYLAGAVRLQTPVNGSTIYTKVVEVE